MEIQYHRKLKTINSLKIRPSLLLELAAFGAHYFRGLAAFEGSLLSESEIGTTELFLGNKNSDGNA